MWLHSPLVRIEIDDGSLALRHSWCSGFRGLVDVRACSSHDHPGGVYVGQLLFTPKTYLPNNAERQKIYDNIASKYNSMVGSEEQSAGVQKRRAQLMQYAHGSVIELACGTGRNFEFTVPGSIDELVALDQSSAMLKEAQQTASKLTDRLPSKIEFLQLDFPKEMPSDSTGAVRQFDTVIDTFGLCSYDDPAAAISAMKQLLKPNGRLLLLEHGESDNTLVNRVLESRAAQHAKKFGCVWNRPLKPLLEQSDLRIDLIEPFMFGHGVLVVASLPSAPASELPAQPLTMSRKLADRLRNFTQRN